VADGSGEDDTERRGVMTGRQVLDFQLARLTKAIHLLWDEDLVIPALMLLYATIDGLAWLQRKDLKGNSNSGDFRDWVDRYLLPDWKTAVTSEALWAARCALLHSQAAESRQSRAGKVPEIWYRWHDLGMVPLGASVPMRPLIVHPGQFIEKFAAAIVRFRTAWERDAKLCQQVEEQAMKQWTPMLFPPDTKE
jgi:hypothetical protein